MVRFNYFHFNLLIGLFLFLPQNIIRTLPNFDNRVEVIYASDDNQKTPLVFDLGIETNQVPFAPKTSKLPMFQYFNRAEHLSYVTHEPKLLYIGIGNAIELKLTSKDIIFPFHFFT